MSPILEIRNTIEVLLVESHPGDAYTVQKMLHEDQSTRYNVTWVKNLRNSILRLESGGYGLILLDLTLPDCTGLGTFDQIYNACPDVPIVIVTNLDDERAAIGAVKRGAEDYFILNYGDSRLLARVIRYAIDRHRALVALRESEQRATAIMNSILIGIIVSDAETRQIVDVNAVAEQLIGVPREKVVGRDYGEFIRYDSTEVSESNGTIRYRAEKESTLLTDAGSEIPVILNIFLVEIHNRQHVVVSFLDLRPRKATENALKESKVRYRILFNSVSDAIYACPLTPENTWGLMNEGNDVLCQRLGYTRAELLQMPVSGILTIHEDLFPQVTEKLFSGERVIFEAIEVAKNHAEFPVEASAHSFDFYGQPCVLFITRDIAERKQQEALAVQQSKLEEREQVIQEFIAKFSHELRNPLNIVIGFTNLLADQQLGPLTPEQADCVADVHASGEYLLALINEILDIAKIESGIVEIPREWFSLGELLAGIMAPVSQSNERQNHTIAYDVADKEFFIYSSMLKLQQVLLNLLTNAIKFTPPGGHVTLTISETGPNKLYFCVKDDGIGIREEDKPRIFQKFTRLNPEIEGTGLGLALSKQIVAHLGGDLQFESKFEKGSTFFFTILY